MRKIFVDTETTGLSAAKGHRIIEVGAIEVDSKITKKKSFHCYLNPEKIIDPFAIEIHGITNEFVADKPKFKDIMWNFIDFIKGAEIINGKREGYWGVHFGDRVIELNYVNGILNGKVTDTYIGEVHKTTGFRPVLQEFAKMYKDGELVSQELTLDQTDSKAEIQYSQLLAKEVQDEQYIARSLMIEDQLNLLQNAYINNIAARVKSFWRYQSAEDDWTAEVYVIQDRNGNVKAVDVINANVGNSSLGKSFMDSIERAVNKASPFPAAPDDAVFDREIYMLFSVN